MRRPVDHLVLAARNLDAVVSFYRRLGFLVGARNHHPWGTENNIVQLGDAFLELIGFEAGFEPLGSDNDAASFANTLARFIGVREGLALMSLQSADALEDARHFAALGIGLGRSLHFSRSAEAADGTRKTVSFTTAFALDPSFPVPAFFVCQHHQPDNFWDAAKQKHPNGARRLLGGIMIAERPHERAAFMRDLFGQESVAEHGPCLVVAAGPQRLDVVPPDIFAAGFGVEPPEGFAAYRIGVESLTGVQSFLNVSGLPYAHDAARIVVPARVGHGVTISFEASP